MKRMFTEKRALARGKIHWTLKISLCVCEDGTLKIYESILLFVCFFFCFQGKDIFFFHFPYVPLCISGGPACVYIGSYTILFPHFFQLLFPIISKCTLYSCFGRDYFPDLKIIFSFNIVRFVNVISSPTNAFLPLSPLGKMK